MFLSYILRVLTRLLNEVSLFIYITPYNFKVNLNQTYRDQDIDYLTITTHNVDLR